MRVMLGEISTEDNRAEAFSIWTSAGNIGMLLAPVAGGVLARPADNFAFFRQSRVFIDYPYLLPSLLQGLLGGIATLLAIFLLKEVSSRALAHLT